MDKKLWKERYDELLGINLREDKINHQLLWRCLFVPII